MSADKCYHFSILGEVDSKELVIDALMVLEGMGLNCGDVVVSHRPIKAIYPIAKYERWL